MSSFPRHKYEDLLREMRAEGHGRKVIANALTKVSGITISETSVRNWLIAIGLGRQPGYGSKQDAMCMDCGARLPDTKAMRCRACYKLSRRKHDQNRQKRYETTCPAAFNMKSDWKKENGILVRYYGDLREMQP